MGKVVGRIVSQREWEQDKILMDEFESKLIQIALEISKAIHTLEKMDPNDPEFYSKMRYLRVSRHSLLERRLDVSGKIAQLYSKYQDQPCKLAR